MDNKDILGQKQNLDEKDNLNKLFYEFLHFNKNLKKFFNDIPVLSDNFFDEFNKFKKLEDLTEGGNFKDKILDEFLFNVSQNIDDNYSIKSFIDDLKVRFLYDVLNKYEKYLYSKISDLFLNEFNNFFKIAIHSNYSEEDKEQLRLFHNRFSLFIDNLLQYEIRTLGEQMGIHEKEIEESDDKEKNKDINEKDNLNKLFYEFLHFNKNLKKFFNDIPVLSDNFFDEFNKFKKLEDLTEGGNFKDKILDEFLFNVSQNIDDNYSIKSFIDDLKVRFLYDVLNKYEKYLYSKISDLFLNEFNNFFKIAIHNNYSEEDKEQLKLFHDRFSLFIDNLLQYEIRTLGEQMGIHEKEIEESDDKEKNKDINEKIGGIRGLILKLLGRGGF